MKLRCPVCDNEVDLVERGKKLKAICPWHCDFSIRAGALSEPEKIAMLNNEGIVRLEVGNETIGPESIQETEEKGGQNEREGTDTRGSAGGVELLGQ